MAESNVKKNQEQAGEGGQQAQATQQQSGRQAQAAQQEGGQQGSMQTRGQQSPQRGLSRRSPAFPSLMALSPREFFSMNPFEMMRRFTDEMDRAFEGFGLAPAARGTQTSLWTPAVEIFEQDGNLVVYAELPGLNKEDVRVEVTDQGLVIQGERRREQEENRQGFYRSERSYGSFYRLIPLSEEVNAEEARANFNNGILEVTLPMPTAQQRRRQIPIGEGGGQRQAPAGAAGETAGGQQSRSTGSGR